MPPFCQYIYSPIYTTTIQLYSTLHAASWLQTTTTTASVGEKGELGVCVCSVLVYKRRERRRAGRGDSKGAPPFRRRRRKEERPAWSPTGSPSKATRASRSREKEGQSGIEGTQHDDDGIRGSGTSEEAKMNGRAEFVSCASFKNCAVHTLQYVGRYTILEASRKRRKRRRRVCTTYKS